MNFKSEEKHNVADILHEIDKEALVDFLAEYADYDAKFVNAVYVSSANRCLKKK